MNTYTAQQLFFSILCSTLILAVTSCSNDIECSELAAYSDMELEMTLSMPDSSHIIDLSRAISIANKELSKISSRSYISTSSESYPIFNDEGDLIAYVINYTPNRGFVIVSAYTDYFPIIAHSDHGSFNISNLPDPAKDWLDDQISLQAYRSSLPDSVKEVISSLWMDYNPSVKYCQLSRSNIDKPQVYYDSLMKWTNEHLYEIYTYNDYKMSQEYNSLTQTERDEIQASIIYFGNSNYGGHDEVTIILRRIIEPNYPTRLTYTNWGQQSGYNALVPGNYKLGCSTVAAGQIMMYHKYPNYFDWQNMNNYAATDASKTFLYELANRIGVNFGKEESPATIDQMKSALESFGYTVIKQSHSAASVLNQIDLRKPVLMNGSNGNKGHAWVCDGASGGNRKLELRVMTLPYRPTASITPTEMVEAMNINKIISYSTVRFRMNWGWYGNGDGYFLDNDLTVSDGSTTSNYSKNRIDLLISPRK